eukprot:488462_1
MQSSKQYRQSTIASYLNKQCHSLRLMHKHRKYETNKNNKQQFLFPFSHKYNKYNNYNENKSISPSPTTMLKSLDLTKQNSNNNRKRKLNENKTNCLQKITLSDGSVCYTMSSKICEPPTKKLRSNSYNCKNEMNNEIGKKQKQKQKPKPKPKLIYSNTMPFPSNDNKKRKRRHTEDWTSKDNLLESLKQQESIEDKLFPSNNIPSVNLEEIFNGQQFIRVHKKIRPINLRRETQIFKK